jgi:fatty-acyl-CoA synthase
VRCTHRKIAGPGLNLAERFQLGHEDACYLSMPMFHSNAVMAGWGPALAAGATMVLARKFSASGFFPDVRRYSCTYANYVGKPLAYVLATPEQPDDADNPLRVAFGNEGGNRDIELFAARFGCVVVDGFGSTEGGVNVGRTPDSPSTSLGRPAPGVSIRNPATNEECPRAEFDPNGVLLNAEDAIGEIVNTDGAGAFEGYYRNEEADAERMRNGWYWSGDLAYADADGYYYFAGRSLDWLRVDGENFGAAPVERLLLRHPDVNLAAVYAVPAPDAGDDVMAALLLNPGATFDPEGFRAFLGEQPDLGSKWAPRFVVVTDQLPQTATNKILKRVLAAARWRTTDPIWWRPGRTGGYERFEQADRIRHEAEFERHGRADVLRL